MTKPRGFVVWFLLNWVKKEVTKFKSKTLKHHLKNKKKKKKETYRTKRELPPLRHRHSNDRKDLIKISKLCRKIQLVRQYFWNLISQLSDSSYGPRSPLWIKWSKSWWSYCLQMQILGSGAPAPTAHLGRLEHFPWHHGFDCLNGWAIYCLQIETGECYPFSNELSNWWENTSQKWIFFKFIILY